MADGELGTEGKKIMINYFQGFTCGDLVSVFLYDTHKTPLNQIFCQISLKIFLPKIAGSSCVTSCIARMQYAATRKLRKKSVSAAAASVTVSS